MPSGSNDLPPGKERAAPCFALRQNLPVYLVFQPIRFTRSDCHQPEPWALTPHFHPYLVTKNRDETVIFCGTCCFRRPRNLPVRKYGALCCPDFPLPFCKKKRQNTLLFPLRDLSWGKDIKELDTKSIGRIFGFGRWRNFYIAAFGRHANL